MLSCCVRCNMENTPKTAIVVGAGSRGSGYPYYAKVEPNRLTIVGVCEPRKFYRERTVKLFDIAKENVFTDWAEAAARDKFADSVIICTPDRLHKTTEEECREIVSTCKANHVVLSVCHVLRYTPWVKKVKEIIDSGVIGQVVNINHESDSSFSLLAKCCHDVDLICYWMNHRCDRVSSFGNLSHFCKQDKVGYWHFAHSFVRGNWSREADSSFALLAKCCHDVDLVCYWMSHRKCERVSSFGNLSHFTANDKGNTGWPVSVICEVPDIESVTNALRTGPYGKCVYDTDNDVMSHQVVNMQFEGGATATLQMVAFTRKICAREVKIYGTKGQIEVNDGDVVPIKVYDFVSKKPSHYQPEEADDISGPLMGHGGADYHTIKAFVDTLHDNSEQSIETGPDATLASHVVCFAAERARKENRVLNLNQHGVYE
ncbi:UGNO-like protein [Mya arenaria]|uniref:UGNO-like protein n=1 Tax=Mya arenaria TaxID=6604 RepID=A0ABY7DQA7_MYAAR|nr:UGNO-like protein [Mya arenaria]